MNSRSCGAVNYEDLKNLNSQMLGSEENQIIDVTSIVEVDTTKPGMSSKFKWMLLLGSIGLAAIAVGIIALKESVSTSPIAVVVPPEITVSSPVFDLVPQSAVPAFVPLLNPLAEMPVIDSASAVIQAPAANNVDLVADLQKQLLEAKNALDSKTAELEEAKHSKPKENLKVKEIPESQIAPSVATLSQAPVLIEKNSVKKEMHILTRANSGIDVLMHGALIYTSKGESIELSIGDNFPGFGRLIKVDKKSQTFETPHNIYYLKD